MENNILNVLWRYIPDEYVKNIIEEEKINETLNVEYFDFKLVYVDSKNYKLLSNITDNEVLMYKKFENKEVYESKEVIVKENINFLGNSIYSFKIYLKFINNKLSPVSSIYVKRSEKTKKTFAFSLENVHRV